MSKPPKKIVSRIATKPFRLPFNWAIPRHTVGSIREFKFKSSRYPVCPKCSLNRFHQKEFLDEDGLVNWYCPSCDLVAVTEKRDLAAIQEWCHENAKEVFQSSPYQQERRENFESDSEDSFIAINIKRNMIGCYAFLLLASIIGMLFIYAAFKLHILLLFNSLIFSLTCLMMALIFNYRAWQAKTNSLYSDNGKAQLYWWIQTHPWFREPKDIGVMPEKKPQFKNKLKKKNH